MMGTFLFTVGLTIMIVLSCIGIAYILSSDSIIGKTILIVLAIIIAIVFIVIGLCLGVNGINGGLI